VKGNCLIAQSGGPTAVMNNSLYGVIEAALLSDRVEKVWGTRRGIYGLLHRDYIDLTQFSAAQLRTLRSTPGAALGSWRYKLTVDDVERIISNMQANNVRYFFFIGGNGSMQAAHMIREAARTKGYELFVMGIPKTVDNDLMYTDHAPGFGSAAKFLATCLVDIGMDISSMPKSNRVTIVETMGRNTGWLAASCALARRQIPSVPQLVYIPEIPFSVEQFLQDVHQSYTQSGSVLVVVSEGVRNSSGQFVAGESISLDAIGRPQLGGVASYLASVIEKQLDLSARYILPSIWQRSGMLFSSGVDAEEAYLAGKHAFLYTQQETTGKMVNLTRIPGHSYAVSFGTVPLADVAGKERLFPLQWYDTEAKFVKQPFLDYVSPLIQGEVWVPRDNGLPVYESIVL
jgi:ATP-dependent phosphofructokinase / diphosphate-dependent phosphofructokinase